MYSTFDWFQIYLFIFICFYPFFVRNTVALDHTHPPEERHIIIQFISAFLTLGFISSFLLMLIILEFYQLSEPSTSARWGVFDTARMVSKLVGGVLIPKERNSSNKLFISIMETLTGPIAMCMYFLWSVTYYPGIFWKDIWWVNLLLFFIAFVTIWSICVYRAYT